MNAVEYRVGPGNAVHRGVVYPLNMRMASTDHNANLKFSEFLSKLDTGASALNLPFTSCNFNNGH